MTRPPFLERVTIWFFKLVNKVIVWHRLPPLLGSLNLLALRYELRAENLHDTYPSAASQGTPESVPPPDPRFVVARSSDGRYNSLEQPLMGCSGARFGRNVPRTFTAPPPDDAALLTPNPRLVSTRLLARTTFKPATIINLLAAAWIQFQVHDWANHEKSTSETVRIPLPHGDSWTDPEMALPRSHPDGPLDDMDRKYPAYRNQETHWWDASQIYGSDEARTTLLRGAAPGGKLILDEAHPAVYLPRDAQGIPLTGFNTNWWLGLELMHTLFAREHNAIATHLAEHHPDWSADRVFDVARLVNCALMAKIHTVEWTTAILAHPTMQISMRANWWGLLGERIYKLIGRVSSSEAISGIPGSGAEQFGASYSLTEEFVSVYRLHPLIPDEIAFSTVTDKAHRTTLPMIEVAFEKARTPMQEPHSLSFADMWYSFGTAYPGAMTTRNHPRFLRDLRTPDGLHLDIAAVDILRDRERGVPRYNAFRRLMHMPPARTFEELVGSGAENAALAAEVREIYGDDIEAVDLQVGMLCEPAPKGFGFSDTAFRVFILMASRRLKSDRFVATDWNVERYSKEGMKWVQDGDMKQVLKRHYPELGSVLDGLGSRNVFAPWETPAK
jgi:hypothetical protein